MPFHALLSGCAARFAPAALAAGVILTAASLPALAVCPAPTVLLEDQFATLAPEWGEASPAVKVENGQMVISPAEGTYAWVVNNAGLYDDIDACVTVTTVTGADSTEAFAGLIFWYQDVNNFYAFQIAPNGRASVWRRQRGKWLAQVEWLRAEDANDGDGATNELRVKTVGSEATFTVNGTEFRKIEGSPPEQGQQIGLLVGSPEDAVAVFSFDSLRVTKP